MKTCPRNEAFSLIELLVVIGVIGIIAALAIPNISNISTQATFAKDQKNAQHIASVAAQARAAGYISNWSTVTNAVSILSANNGEGVSIQFGGSPVQVGISGLTPNDVAGATNYLNIVTNIVPDVLEYSP